MLRFLLPDELSQKHFYNNTVISLTLFYGLALGSL